MHTTQNAVSSFGSQVQLSGDFFNKLSPEALRDLSSMALVSNYQPGRISIPSATWRPASTSSSTAK
jgi:hypothetical protein